MNILTPEEVTVTQMALQSMIEDVESVTKNMRYNLSPEARTQSREMLSCAKSALDKLSKTSGHLVQLDQYAEGDEKEFLTKES